MNSTVSPAVADAEVDGAVAPGPHARSWLPMLFVVAAGPLLSTCQTASEPKSLPPMVTFSTTPCAAIGAVSAATSATTDSEDLLKNILNAC